MRRRVLTLAGTRPELIRLSALIPQLDEFFDHTFVHTGQNPQKDMKDVFFEDLGIRQPDFSFFIDTSSVGRAMSSLFAELEKVLVDIEPDAVLALGDTNSALGLLLAKRMGILTYHMEAGNRSFDENVPEEVNRRVIDHLADFNLCYTENARNNLLREGVNPRFIAVTGSPIPEVARRLDQTSDHSEVLTRFGLKSKSYFLVSLHRQETLDYLPNFERALGALQHTANTFGLPLLISGHPRFVDRFEALKLKPNSLFDIRPPFGFRDYQSLQLNASCVISDSGTISEEAAALGFPAVTIRKSMERPEALERGTVMLTGLDKFDLANAVGEVMTASARDLTPPEGYLEANFSKRVLRFIASTLGEGRNWKGLEG